MAFRSFRAPFEHGADHTIIGSEPFCTVAVVGPGATLLKGIGYVSLGEVALKRRPVPLQRRAFSDVFQPEDVFFRLPEPGGMLQAARRRGAHGRCG